MPYFRLRGVVETDRWGTRTLRCPDTGDPVSLGHSDKLFSCDDGAFIEVVGRPFVGASRKSGGLFINFEVEDWRYVECEYAPDAPQSSSSLEFVKYVLKERSIEGRGLQTRQFP